MCVRCVCACTIVCVCVRTFAGVYAARDFVIFAGQIYEHPHWSGARSRSVCVCVCARACGCSRARCGIAFTSAHICGPNRRFSHHMRERAACARDCAHTKPINSVFHQPPASIKSQSLGACASATPHRARLCKTHSVSCRAWRGVA